MTHLLPRPAINLRLCGPSGNKWYWRPSGPWHNGVGGLVRFPNPPCLGQADQGKLDWTCKGVTLTGVGSYLKAGQHKQKPPNPGGNGRYIEVNMRNQGRNDHDLTGIMMMI